MSEEQTPSIEMKVEAREGSVIKNVTQIIGSHYPLLRDFVYEFKERIEEHTKRFVGREFIFQELDKFRENHSCGYFRVIAEAGLGKTAIAAAVANQYDAPVFFVNASEGWVAPSQCLKHLCAVLIARYELDHKHLPERSGDDANFLSQLLREAAEKEAKKEKPGPIWVVVDALDEAESPSERNILLLPSQIPDGVYFLLTHRPGSYNIQLTGNTRSVDYELRGDSLEQQRDIESFLQTQANSPEIRQAIDKAQVPSERFVAVLKETSQGNFMYLTYVLRDIGQQESGFNPLNLNQLPQGLEAYYELFWKRMKGAVQEKDWDLCEQVLERLATAGEPITEQWLADHTQKKALDIRNKVLVPWRRFLSQGNLGEQKTWRIIHKSFTDFLTEKLDLEASHRTIADYYKHPTHWRLHDGYAFRHRSTHLRQAKGYDQLFALVENEDWYQAQEQYDVSSNSYLNDVNEAWLAAETINTQAAENDQPIPLLVQEIRCALLTSSLNSRSTNIPPELLVRLLEEKKWTPTQALATIRHNADEIKKAKSIELIAPFLKSDPNLIKRALEIVRAIRSESTRACVLTGLTPLLTPQQKQEVLTEALTITREIRDESDRAQALTGLAPLLSPQLKQEVLTEALSIKREISDKYDTDILLLSQKQEISDKYYRVDVLTRLAPHLSPQQLTEALSFIWKMNKQSDRADVLTGLAPLLSPQHLTEALSITREMSNQYYRAQALTGLAPHLSPQHLTEALSITRKMSNQYYRAQALTGLAPHLSPQHLTEALSLIREISDKYYRAQALTGLAPLLSAQQKQEVLAEILSITQEISDKYYRAQALTGLALLLSAQQKQEVLAEILSITQEISDKYYRANVLKGLAPHLSPQHLTEALSLMREISDKSDRADVLMKLAPLLFPQKEQEVLTEAISITQEISDKSDRAQALTGLASHLSPQQLTEALSLIREISNKFYSFDVLSKHSASQWDWPPIYLLSILKEISPKTYFTDALTILAPHLSPQQLTEALSITREMSNQYYRAQALTGLAPHLSPQHLTEALSLIREISDKSDRAQALTGLAPLLSKFSIPSLYSLWKDTLRPFAMLKRESLLSDLVALVPMIVTLGGDEVVREMAQAIQEVGRRFP